MTTDNEIKLVFIVGSGRCGSSLVHELISQHRDVGFISNIDDNLPQFNMSGRFNNLLFRSPLGKLRKKGGLRFAPSEAYGLISRTVSPIYANSHRNLRASDVTPYLRQAFRKFFLDRYRAQRKNVFVHKYTGWSRVGFFKEIFPEAKFIHIIRDGRAVANSFLQMAWWTGYLGPDKWYLGPISVEYRSHWERSNYSFLVLAGIAWEILVNSVDEDARGVGQDGIRTVRYEDFLHDPTGQIRSLCDFAELDFSDELAARIRSSGINTLRKQAFTADLLPAQVAELTSCISSSLSKYGYADV